MRLPERLAAMIEAQVADFLACPEFRALETGRASREAYDGFLANVVRTHLKATELVAFLYALAPPASAGSRLQNLLDELHHPVLLRQLASGAGLGDRLAEIDALAADDVRRVVVEPLLYDSLRELGLAVLLEIVAFECLLARTASRVADFLDQHRGLGPAALRWWTEHAEADARHAVEGLGDLARYVEYYEITEPDALAIAEVTLRDNVFVRRYFRRVPAGSREMDERCAW